MKAAITGASGLIGTALVPFLKSRGHEVLRLVRRRPQATDELPWDPERGEIDHAALEGVNAVVHLAGANLAEGRWTAARKAVLRESRVTSTGFLAETLARLSRPPSVLVSSSAIGYYGNRGGEWLDETAAPGNGFLARLVADWEGACEPAAGAGIRVVPLRSGMVLTAGGGALGRMLLPFRLGMAGVLGPGTQFMSWIALDDLLGALLFVIDTPALTGPVNTTTPTPVTNREFTKTLGRVLRRPTIAPAPGFVLRLLFGELADAALLASARVLPRRLREAGFAFRFPELEAALRHLLARPRSPESTAAR